MSTKRFSRSSLLDDLIERADALKEKYDFDEHNGWDQVKGKDVNVIVDYERFSQLCDLIDEWSAA